MSDALLGGNGSDLIAGGFGADNIIGGAGHDILVEGSVSVRTMSKTFRSILDSWALLPSPVDSNYSAVTTDLLFVADKAARDTLTGGLGIDWFWSATAGAVVDVTDKLVAERRRLL